METSINTHTQFEKKEVLEASLKYFDGDELAATTWINKYCLRDKEGNYLELTPDDMHKRLAKQFFTAENKLSIGKKHNHLSRYGQKRKALTEKVIYRLLKDFKYLVPQGSIMALLGNTYAIGSLSNCVVLKSPVDSYGGIFYTDQQIAQLCKRRCGVGFDISTIRPKGQQVHNAAGTSSGLISFMERFSNTTREVSQNGRRGALMLTIDISHPDILDFIQVKQDLQKVTGANISVRISNEFMKAVENDDKFTLKWPVESEKPVFEREINAKELWNEIITAAHKTAEPGIIFWDHQHNYSTSSIYPEFRNESTNPCSEIAMQGGDSCRLMALNLFNFVVHPFTSEAHFDYKLFYETTYEAQRLMDDLVELELESIDRIISKIESDPESELVKTVELETWKMLRKNGQKGRRTGLGFTALADTMSSLGLKFDTDEAIEVIDQIMKIKCEAEFDSSIDMAAERGSFPAFDKKVEEKSDFIKFFKDQYPESFERMQKNGRRNISISTVAPTGTVSLLTQTSSGIEPVFMLHYKRRRKLVEGDNSMVDYIDDSGDKWQEFDVYHSKLKEWMKSYPGKAIEQSPYFGATAPEIDWEKRIEIQSVVQKYVTHSISSTINLPADTPVSTVKNIYQEAWKKGLKGITVYRDGSRSGVLISDKEKKEDEIKEIKAPKRPETIHAKVIRFKNDSENWMAFIGMLQDRPYEIFTGRAEDAFALPPYVNSGEIIKSKDKSDNSRYDFRYQDTQGYNVTIEGLSRSFSRQYWNYAKLISGILRHGMPIVDVVELIENLNLDKEHINNWKNGVSRALKIFIPDGTISNDHHCTQCGDESGLVYEEGCLVCKSCGYTKCN